MWNKFIKLSRMFVLLFAFFVIYLFMTLPFASAQGIQGSMQGYFQGDSGRVTIEQIRHGLFSEMLGLRQDIPNAFAQVSDQPISEFGDKYGLLVSVPDGSIDYVQVVNPRTEWEQVYSMDGQTQAVFPIEAVPGDEIELTGLVQGDEETSYWQDLMERYDSVFSEGETYSVNIPITTLNDGVEDLIISAELSGTVGANSAEISVVGEEGTPFNIYKNSELLMETSVTNEAIQVSVSAGDSFNIENTAEERIGAFRVF